MFINRKYREDYYINKVNSLGYEFVEFVGDFDGKNSIIRYKCPLGHITQRKLGVFLKTLTCGQCSKNHVAKIVKETKTISIEEAYRRLYEKHGDSIIMSNYIGMHSDANFECVHCHSKWTTRASSVLVTGRGCDVCVRKDIGKKRIFPIEKVKDLLYKKHGNDISITRYTAMGEISEFECNICGHIWETRTEAVVRQGEGCSACYYKYATRENSPAWKGGISPISNWLRNKLNGWFIDSMKTTNNRCYITGKYAEVVHHIYPFQRIIKETFLELNIIPKNEINNYSNEELEMIQDKFFEIHSRYPLGIPLTKKVHNKFHALYTNNADLEDWYNFVNRISIGEIQI